MHKQIIIILVLLNPVVSNILSTFSLGEAFAQVIIKDEIVLDEIIPDAVSSGVETPEYGQVRVWYVVNHSEPFVEVTLQVGGNSEMIWGPWNCPCTSQNLCAYVGDYVYRYYNNIPAGSTVSIQAARCVDGEWVAIPVTYGGWVQQFNYYKLNYTVNYGGEVGEQFGNAENLLDVENEIRVYPQTPPGCANANNYCDNTYLLAPRIELQARENDGTYGISNEIECSTHPTWPSYSTLARQKPGEFNYTTCFDRQYQKWRINIISNNTIYMNWIYDYCPQNLIPGTLRENIYDIPPEYPRESLRYDVERHLHYNPNPGPYYFFKDLLYFHEIGHMELLQEYIDYYLPTFYYYYVDKLLMDCLEFNPNDPNSLDELELNIARAINRALKLAETDYNLLLSEDFLEDTETKLIHPRAVPHIQNVLNTIICP